MCCLVDQVVVRAIEVPTVLVDFADYWTPFLGGQGPAPVYVMFLIEEHRGTLADLLHTGCRAVHPPSGRWRHGLGCLVKIRSRAKAYA